MLGLLWWLYNMWLVLPWSINGWILLIKMKITGFGKMKLYTMGCDVTHWNGIFQKSIKHPYKCYCGSIVCLWQFGWRLYYFFCHLIVIYCQLADDDVAWGWVLFCFFFCLFEDLSKIVNVQTLIIIHCWL